MDYCYRWVCWRTLKGTFQQFTFELNLLYNFFLYSNLQLFFWRNGRVNVLSLYIHRYIRLTPIVGVCILLIVSLYRFAGSGPLWNRFIEDESEKCEKYWWLTLLYVQNYVNVQMRVSRLPSSVSQFQSTKTRWFFRFSVSFAQLVLGRRFPTLSDFTGNCLFDASV